MCVCACTHTENSTDAFLVARTFKSEMPIIFKQRNGQDPSARWIETKPGSTCNGTKAARGGASQG